MAKHELLEDTLNKSDVEILCLTETHYKSDIDVLQCINFSIWYKIRKFNKKVVWQLGYVIR